MGLIKDLLRYPTKAFPVAADTVIGTDSENGGQTVNFSVGTLLGTDNPLLQDNKFKIINIGVFREEDLTNLSIIAKAINSLPILLAEPDYKTVEADQIPIFVGLANGGTDPNTKGSEYVSSVAIGHGKGEYGVDGDHTLTQDDVFIINSTVVTGVPSYEDDPNANVEDLGEIPDGDYLSVINVASPQYTITAGTNWYFDFTVNGDRFVYGFQGENGNYGLGVTQMVENDLFLIYDETADIAIDNTQIAVGTGSGLEGDKNLTWDGIIMSIDSTDGLSEYTSESIDIFNETQDKRMLINQDGFSFLNYGNDSYMTLDGLKLEFSDNFPHKIAISPPNTLTGDFTATLQDKSGILAYLSDFVLQGLQSVLDTGVTAFSDDTSSYFTLDPENTMFNVNLTDGVTNANILFVEDSLNVSIGHGSNTGSLNLEAELIGLSRSSNLGEVSFYIGDPKVGGTEISLETPSTANIGEKFVIPLSVDGIKADSDADIDLTSKYIPYVGATQAVKLGDNTLQAGRILSVTTGTTTDGLVFDTDATCNKSYLIDVNGTANVARPNSGLNLLGSGVMHTTVFHDGDEMLRVNSTGVTADFMTGANTTDPKHVVVLEVLDERVSNFQNRFLVYDVSQDVFQHTAIEPATVKTWTIPANTIKDGDILVIKAKINRLNGSSGNPGMDVELGGASLVNLNNGQSLHRHVVVKGGDLIQFNTSGSYPQDLASLANSIDWNASASPDLTTDLDIELELDFSTANTDEFRLVMFTIERVGTNMEIET